MATVIAYNGGLFYLLQQVFPSHNWDMSSFDNYKQFVPLKQAQMALSNAVSRLFPSNDVVEEYAHPLLSSSMTQQPLTLDAYVLARDVAFEFQGKHHFQNTDTLFGSAKQLENDHEKRKLCLSAGITLVEVPYWWDKTQASLRSIMHAQGVSCEMPSTTK